MKVGIIGLGRLGLAAALCMEKHGVHIVGCEISERVVQQVNDRTFDSPEPSVTPLLKESKNLKATTSLEEAVDFSDLILIFVDTPTGVGESKSYDHSKLGKVLSAINSLKPKNKHISIGCTVQPGYIANVGKMLVEDCEGCTLNYNPEFIAQGSIVHDFLHPDMVLIGCENEAAGDRLAAVYGAVVENEPRICKMSPASSEICKLAVNCYVTMKITFANMVGDVADRTEGADKFDILGAIGEDSRVGTKCLMPGYGFGGPCFPRDNRAFGYHATAMGVQALLSEATDAYNKKHAAFQAEDFLKQNLDTYVFEDVVYKDNCLVPIIEESQKLAVGLLIARAGKRVLIRDREEIILLVKQEYGNIFEYETL